MTTRTIAILSLFLLLTSCKWKMEEKPVPKEEESPVVSSLKESGLPCFGCHPYERFALNERGKFSHPRHMKFDIHCNQCHVIESHKKSAVNRDVCNNCHNISNFSYPASGMAVTFSHQSHAKKFNCSECHPAAFNMKQGTTKITMDEMYKGETCGRCHNGKVAFSSYDCAKCHKMTGFNKELSYPSGGVSPAVFSHGSHTSMFECTSCHTSIFKYKKGGSGMKMDSIYRGEYCGKCHNGQTAFGPMACKRCHK